MLPHVLDDGQKVTASGFTLILKTTKDRDVTGREQHSFHLPQPSVRSSNVVVMAIPVGQHDIVRWIAHDQLHGLIR